MCIRDSGITTRIEKEETQIEELSQVITTDPDNLKVVEGIGPKIEQLLYEVGINTWKGLSETPSDELKIILGNAGSRYKMHDPSTWSEQAKLAAQGKWSELSAWQDKLNGGTA